jgi:hypothetical protein
MPLDVEQVPYIHSFKTIETSQHNKFCIHDQMIYKNMQNSCNIYTQNSTFKNIKLTSYNQNNRNLQS